MENYAYNNCALILSMHNVHVSAWKGGETTCEAGTVSNSTKGLCEKNSLNC